MVCAPVRRDNPRALARELSLKLGDYLSVQAHKPCSISHIHENASGIYELNQKFLDGTGIARLPDVNFRLNTIVRNQQIFLKQSNVEVPFYDKTLIL